MSVMIENLIKQNPTSVVSSLLQKVREDPKGRVIAFDIDNCSALGNDTNGILQIISLLTDNFQTKKDEICSIATLLINPELFMAVEEIRRQSNPFFVFYTMKSGIVDLCHKEPLQRRLDSAKLFSKNKNSIIFRSGDSEKEGWDYLYNQIKCGEKDEHVYMQLCKVGIITWCISHYLKLPYLAPVYITREHKFMGLIDEDLKIGENKSFLFDDKAVDHTHALGFSHGEESRMVQVEPFDFMSLTPEHRFHIGVVLYESFPLTEEVLNKHPWILIDASRERRHETAVDPSTRNWRDLMELPIKPIVPWDVSLLIRQLPLPSRLLKA